MKSQNPPPSGSMDNTISTTNQESYTTPLNNVPADTDIIQQIHYL